MMKDISDLNLLERMMNIFGLSHHVVRWTVYMIEIRFSRPWESPSGLVGKTLGRHISFDCGVIISRTIQM